MLFIYSEEVSPNTMKILEGGRTFSSGLHAEISVPVVTKKGLKMAGDSNKHAIMI